MLRRKWLGIQGAPASQGQAVLQEQVFVAWGGGPGLLGAAAALQGSLFAGQRGDPPQVFPDFHKLRRVLFLLLRGFFQLVQPLLPSQQLLLEGTLQPLGLLFLLLLLDELVPPPVLQHALQLGLAVHAQAPPVVHEQLSVQLLVAPRGLHWVQQLLGLDELRVPLSVIWPGHQAPDVRPLPLDLGVHGGCGDGHRG